MSINNELIKKEDNDNNKDNKLLEIKKCHDILWDRFVPHKNFKKIEFTKSTFHNYEAKQAPGITLYIGKLMFNIEYNGEFYYITSAVYFNESFAEKEKCFSSQELVYIIDDKLGWYHYVRPEKINIQKKEEKETPNIIDLKVDEIKYLK